VQTADLLFFGLDFLGLEVGFRSLLLYLLVSEVTLGLDPAVARRPANVLF
jgi:hypothetical protein